MAAEAAPIGLRRNAARTATLTVLALGLLATLAANLPGQLSYDSIVQLADGRSGVYHAWHPPIMAWLLGLGDALLPGTALYVTTVTSVLFAAFALGVAAQPRVGWAAPIVALLICASPLLLLEQGVVWKDVLFADMAVSGFLLLAVAARPERPARSRLALLIAGAALLTLAMLTRQNGVIVALLGAGAIGLIAARSSPAARPMRRGAAVGAAAPAAMLLAAAAAGAALNAHRPTGDVGADGQVRLLQLYDLVGVAARAPSVDLSPLHASGLEAEIRAATPLYTPERSDPLQSRPALAAAVGAAPPGLARTWRTAVLQHPVAWLAHRAAVFRWLIAPPDPALCRPIYTGVDGPAPLLAQLGLAPTWRAQDLRLAHYGEAFLRTPLYSHGPFALAAVALIVALLRSRRVDDAVLAFMLAAALAYAASYFLIGIACDHRYLYALDLAVLAAALLFSARFGSDRKPAAPWKTETPRPN